MYREQQPYVNQSKPFSGKGHRLGSVVPEIVGAGSVGQKVTGAEALTDGTTQGKKFFFCLKCYLLKCVYLL